MHACSLTIQRMLLSLYMMIDQGKVFGIKHEEDFNKIALEIYAYQSKYNPIYREYLASLGRTASPICHYSEIPFIPIQFFKTQRVATLDSKPAITFSSSGTTGMVNSQHHVFELSWYEQSYREAFKQFYGTVKDIAIIALLPSYLERNGSSLIYMIDDLIQQSEQVESGYFLYNHDDLFKTLNTLKAKGTKTLLIGVTYALLDFVENYNIDFPDLIVMETGGMKGKRKEMIREELHSILCDGFGVNTIHSEYGMTELLSQGYSYGNGLFRTPPWLKVLIRDTNDPLTLQDYKKTGAINIIDLANVHSCSFIATQDLGKLYADGSFEILGRFDNADIRGCNLLVQ